MRCRNRRAYRAILTALILGLMVPHLALAAIVKLSGTMPAFGNVSSYQISPDGRYAVYRADQETDGVFELYSVLLAGGTSVRLNGALPTGSSVEGDYQISPDSSRVVYRADQDTTGVDELYSVPIAGPASAGVKISGVLVAGGDVSGFRVSPDSKRVVYRADLQTDEMWGLYSVPLAGPANAGVKLSGPMVAGGDVSPMAFQVSPDSKRVVYSADQDTDDVWELYSVPIAGPVGAGVKLNGALVAGGNVSWGFVVSPDSSRAVYLADQDTDDVDELYSVPLAGPASAGVKLNGTLVTGGDALDFQVSPDSSRVVYQADQDTDEAHELYSVPLAGPASAGVRLNGTLVTNGSVTDFQVSPDSSRVVYRADQEADAVHELYSVPLVGPASAGVKLNGALVAGGHVVGDGFRISPDSSRVVYRADQQTDEVIELYSVPLAGPASAGVKLSGPMVAGGEVWGDVQISLDSSRVVYQADQDTDDVDELYRVPLAGPAGAGDKLNGVLVADGDVDDFLISPDSSRVVYRADQDTDAVRELYAADNDYALYLPLVMRGSSG